ncbi:MAG: hypothetical protein QXD77_00495 [Candidatus Aenigmatarchaeota archaeon]
MNRAFLICIAALAILPFIALSQTTEFYVIGITPPAKSICVIPEQTAMTTFRITSNSSADEMLDIMISNVSWAYADSSNITVPADKGFYDLPVYASPPKGTPEDRYSAELYVCTNPQEQGVVAAKMCLKGVLNINVTYSCDMPGVIRIETKMLLRTILIGTIAFLAAILLYRNRKNGLTYLKKLLKK